MNFMISTPRFAGSTKRVRSSEKKPPQTRHIKQRNGGEGGILFREVLKIPVLMVKTNPDGGHNESAQCLLCDVNHMLLGCDTEVPSSAWRPGIVHRI